MQDVSERIPTALRQREWLTRLRIVTAYSVIGFSRPYLARRTPSQRQVSSHLHFMVAVRRAPSGAPVPSGRSTNLRTAATSDCLVAKGRW
ncbi:hypothetical protein PspCFBP13509_10220 [Pseudomonas sp. CFBP13509]|nr:hypothetical protein PspCFBP13509_10220 [Pseudomonas sp. CFBP13509]